MNNLYIALASSLQFFNFSGCALILHILSTLIFIEISCSNLIFTNMWIILYLYGYSGLIVFMCSLIFTFYSVSVYWFDVENIDRTTYLSKYVDMDKYKSAYTHVSNGFDKFVGLIFSLALGFKNLTRNMILLNKIYDKCDVIIEFINRCKTQIDDLKLKSNSKDTNNFESINKINPINQINPNSIQMFNQEQMEEIERNMTPEQKKQAEQAALSMLENFKASDMKKMIEMFEFELKNK